MTQATHQRRARQRGTSGGAVLGMVLYGSEHRCQPPDSRFFDEDADGICPVCDNHSLYDGDSVNVGPGYVQCSPACCQVCGFSTPGYNQPYSLVEFVRKCWELQISPYGGAMWPDDGWWGRSLTKRLGEPDEVVDGATNVWYFDAKGSDRAVFISHRAGTPMVRVWQSNWNGVDVESGEQLDALLLGLRVIMDKKAPSAELPR